MRRDCRKVVGRCESTVTKKMKDDCTSVPQLWSPGWNLSYLFRDPIKWVNDLGDFMLS